VHLRMPSFDPGLTAFLWAVGFGLYLWLGMLAIGVNGATAFIFGWLAAGAIFLFVRLFGGERFRRPARRQSRAGIR
jgi:4-amino-4-deoxy-L-arabinose transferase-like glycosyltransferase